MEARFAKMLDEAGVDFEYEAQTWELLPKQTFQDESIRPVTYTPDFIIGDVAVEIKGFKNDVYPLKRKLIAKFIKENRPDTVFIEAYTVADMRKALDKILSIRK